MSLNSSPEDFPTKRPIVAAEVAEIHDSGLKREHTLLKFIEVLIASNPEIAELVRLEAPLSARDKFWFAAGKVSDSREYRSEIVRLIESEE